MPDSPLQVYGLKGEPGRIALQVARSFPGATVERKGSKFRVTVGAKKGVFHRTPPALVVEIDTAAFDGDRATPARRQVWDDVVSSIRGPGLPRVLESIHHLQIAVSFVPGDPDDLRPTGPLASVALDVAARVDGFILDLHNGRLLSMMGEVLGSTDLLVADGGKPLDPSHVRIQGRLVALLAVAARTLTEYDGKDQEEAREGIARWITSIGMAAELEPHETTILRRPAGGVEESELAFGSWQIEGAAVLAWTLELFDELPPYDQAVDPTVLSGILCFPDPENTRAVLARSGWLPRATVEAEADRHATIYRRLCELAAARSADTDGVEVSLNITSERLRAFRWLLRGGLYSTTQLDG